MKCGGELTYFDDLLAPVLTDRAQPPAVVPVDPHLVASFERIVPLFVETRGMVGRENRGTEVERSGGGGELGGRVCVRVGEVRGEGGGRECGLGGCRVGGR